MWVELDLSSPNSHRHLNSHVLMLMVDGLRMKTWLWLHRCVQWKVSQFLGACPGGCSESWCFEFNVCLAFPSASWLTMWSFLHTHYKQPPQVPNMGPTMGLPDPRLQPLNVNWNNPSLSQEAVIGYFSQSNKKQTNIHHWTKMWSKIWNKWDC